MCTNVQTEALKPHSKCCFLFFLAPPIYIFNFCLQNLLIYITEQPAPTNEINLFICTQRLHTIIYGAPCIYIKSLSARADLEEMVWRAVMTMRGISTERNTAITTISIIVVLCASRCRRVSRLPLHKQRCQRNFAINIHNICISVDIDLCEYAS